METRDLKAACATMLVVAGVGCTRLTTTPAAIAAQGQASKYIYVNDGGAPYQAKTPKAGKIHLSGSLGAATASYSRGVFDGDDTNLDSISIPSALRTTFLLPFGSAGALRHLSFTLGTSNALKTDPELSNDGDIDAWNDSSWYAGFGAELGKGWLIGLTYELYTNPSARSDTHQVALAAAHTGPWSPLAKLEVPTGGDGYFMKAAINPSLRFNRHGQQPWKLAFPVALGVGFDDFYGRGTATTGYLSVGLTASTPLQFMSPDYGSWTLSASLTALIRDDELRRVGPPAASTDTLIPIGIVSISFVY